jgi:3'-phosphoadenosine 5'-phosphosulfate sulfotransferase (PAPS reductase)/FAD synthetase
MLHWSEIDVWRNIKREDIPIVNLYLARDGKNKRIPNSLPLEKLDEIKKTCESSGKDFGFTYVVML